MPDFSNGEVTISVPAKVSLVDHAEELGVPFGCTDGNCGTCLTRIRTGLENMSPYTEKEKVFGLAEDERLLCQAQILQGKVEIKL